MTDQLIYFAALILGEPLQDVTLLLAGLATLATLNKAIKRGWLSEAIERVKTRPEQITVFDLQEE